MSGPSCVAMNEDPLTKIPKLAKRAKDLSENFHFAIVAVFAFLVMSRRPCP